MVRKDNMVNIWDDLLTEQDLAVIREAGYDKKGAASWDSRSLGTNPAVLVIDMQNQLVGDDEPILKAVKKERTAMGEIAWRAMEYILPFVAACREAGLPIIYTRVIPHDRQADAPALQIVTPLQPKNGDLVLEKNYSSAFYGTGLLTRLNQQRIDTVIIVGNSTSGCVRATAVDARQMGFRVMVPQECTFDRIAASHKISLLDMWMKYATVVPVETASEYIANLRNG
jgi:maleamate amidohydrolase